MVAMDSAQRRWWFLATGHCLVLALPCRSQKGLAGSTKQACPSTACEPKRTCMTFACNMREGPRAPQTPHACIT
jgi:hypothetical protein